ncbi:GATA type zinc finger protein asd-4-like [Camellia sinensis]|uniref:GATA type zinc finger protein asd-4-like n=1 Tax=Camellia sinensis TaxID=4442 RepID=UPI001035B608|nr:GATA type zinc finger protein asd-4-like [Camellia sinensis]
MVDETQKPAAPETSVQVTEEVVVVSDVPVAEKELPPAPEPEPEATPANPSAAAAAAEEEVVEAEKSKPSTEEEKIPESASFKDKRKPSSEVPAETSAPAEEVAAPPKEVVVAVAEVVEKVTAIITDDGAQTVEAIKRTPSLLQRLWGVSEQGFVSPHLF